MRPLSLRRLGAGAVSVVALGLARAARAALGLQRWLRRGGPARPMSLGHQTASADAATPLDGLIEHPLEGTHRHANTSPYTDRGYVPALGRLIRPSAGQVEVPLTGFRDTNR